MGIVNQPVEDAIRQRGILVDFRLDTLARKLRVRIEDIRTRAVPFSFEALGWVLASPPRLRGHVPCLCGVAKHDCAAGSNRENDAPVHWSG